MAATPESIELARSAAFAAADRLGTDIVALDVSEQLVLTDAFVIASAPSERQVRAIVDRVEEELHIAHGVKRVRREGHENGRWVLLDFADVIVHVFAAEDREFYALERLWKDCPSIDVTEAVARAGGEADSAPSELAAALQQSADADESEES